MSPHSIVDLVSANQAHEIITMSRDELRDLIRSAVRDEFAMCGLLAETAEQRENTLADFSFLRRLRKGLDGTVYKIGYFVLFGLLSLFGSLAWAGMSAHFGK
jgi:hypothetical protein